MLAVEDLFKKKKKKLLVQSSAFPLDASGCCVNRRIGLRLKLFDYQQHWLSDEATCVTQSWHLVVFNVDCL